MTSCHASAIRFPAALIGVAGLIGGWGVCATEAAGQARWRLSATPSLVIGSTSGPPATTLSEIKGTLLAPDGTIVVADGATSELRVFSSAGTFRRSFGRVGDGPGEFRGIGWIDMCGGEGIVAFDAFHERITKWYTDGTLLDDFSFEAPDGSDMPAYDAACGPSGHFVVIGWPEIIARPRGPYRPTVLIGVTDERGRRQRIIGRFPGQERLRTQSNDRPHPFGKTTTVGIGATGVYVGTANSFAITRIAPDGQRSTFGRTYAVEPLSDEMRERWVDAYVSRAPPEQRPSLKNALLHSEYSEWIPDVAPAYAGFQLDRLGFVWVEPYVIGLPEPDALVGWSVFDPEGTFVATVMMPSNFQPTDIAEDYVLGISTDALGVERVEKYGLTR